MQSLFQAEYNQYRSNFLRNDYYQKLSTWVPYCRLCPFRGYPKEDEIYNKLLCDKGFGFNTDENLIIIKSTQWFAPVLAHNQYFRSRVCDTIGPDIFGTLFKKLFKPKYDILNKIQLMKKQFLQSDRVIGLQIRKIEGNSIDDSQFDVFLRCAKSLSMGAKNPKYFLSADNIETKDHATRLLGINQIIAHNNTLDRSSIDGMKNALIDLWLLGESDEIIISPYSTFGYVAHGRTSKVPYLVTRNNKCVKLLSSQPCFQYWFGITLLPCFKKEHLTVDMLNQEDCWT